MDSDFKNPTEIEIPEEITLKDERTEAFSRENMLFITGSFGILIYDGEGIKAAYEHENVYVPTTYSENGKGESPNLLTRKRINTFIGTANFRETSSTNVFLLDEKIKPGSHFLMEIRIRTRTSEEEPDGVTSQYIGVDSLGKEVGKTVIIRYERDGRSEGDHYFLAEPIRDEAGGIINIKKEDKVLTFDKMPFGMTIKNGREVSVALDLPSPVKGECNVVIKYEAQAGDNEPLWGTATSAVANGEKGGEIMLLNFGDNKIYFTDEKNGFLFLPTKNKISLGSDGEKITAIVKLSDNLVGAFKKNSFYRIKFKSSESDGYEIISSTDLVGTYSGFSTAYVDYDCLVFNSGGVYGVSENKSSSNVFSCLRLRSGRINEHLSKYTAEQRENAQAISYKSKYYLFIGGDVYIAETLRKNRESGIESDAYEYEWWIWDNCQARILYSDGQSLYFGTENGQIRRFYDGFCDAEIRELSSENMSLLLNTAEGYTDFIIPKKEEIKFDLARAYLSSHKRLVSRDAIYENGILYLDNEGLYFSGGGVKLYTGDTVSICKKDGEEILASKISELDLILKSIELNSTEGLTSGELYDIYLCLDSAEYKICDAENGVALAVNGEKITAMDEPLFLTIVEEKPIECIYKTAPCNLDTINLKTLYSLFLKLSTETRGTVEIELETEKASMKREIFVASPISFDELYFETASFQAPFESTRLVRSFLRNFENLTVKIKSKGKENFGLENVTLLYLKSPKPKRI